MQTQKLHKLCLGEATDGFLRKVSINLAVIGFLLHLLFCFLYDFGYYENSKTDYLFDSYLDALYTPFSIILAYEVYELIRVIPESFSNSIGKQFEVVTLLVVRDIFKNLSDIQPNAETTFDKDIYFIATEALAFVVLFSTALFFRYRLSATPVKFYDGEDLDNFVKQKRDLASALVIVFLIVAAFSLYIWSGGVLDGKSELNREVFFLDFFTILIMSDILILLISYRHTTDFLNLARNTGFILSAVIVRVAIGTSGYSGVTLFILAAILAASVLQISLNLGKEFKPIIDIQSSEE
tara:strand:+ start:1824 stop:2708 length:885 start_codon:yes stop_codon:yes gene_type:complete